MDVNDRRARATEEAVHWWARLGTKPPAEVSETDREEFTQWLRESPLHVAELLHVAHVHDSLERFTLWQEIPLEAPHKDDTITALPSARRELTKDEGREHLRRPHRARVLLAACAAALAISAGWLMVRSGATLVETDRAERREVVLGDGSVVKLEPETTLRVDLGKHRRYVALIQGRALFHVAKDSARPFVVHAGNTDVRAVGTIFGVEQKGRSVVVTVSEGKVAVAPTAPVSSITPSSNVPLSADQQLTIQSSGAAGPIKKVDSTRALAWSEGRLIFDSTPLSEVAEEFNRYNHVQLRIRGDELRQRTISGVFRASDPQTLIDFIGAGARVTVTRHGSDEIVIAPAS